MEGLAYSPEGTTEPTESITILPTDELANKLSETTVIDQEATYVQLTSTEEGGDNKKQIVAKVKIKNEKVEIKKISPTGEETDMSETDISKKLLEKLKDLGNRILQEQNNPNLTGNEPPQADLRAKEVTQAEEDLGRHLSEL